MRQKKLKRSCSMEYNYVIKVYADAVMSGLRELESIPETYIKEVRRELGRRGWELKSRKTE